MRKVEPNRLIIVIYSKIRNHEQMSDTNINSATIVFIIIVIVPYLNTNK